MPSHPEWRRPWIHVLAMLLLAGCSGGSAPVVLTSIELDPAEVSFTALGQTRQLLATVVDQRGDPVDGAEVTWSSNDESVATVSETGLVTAVGAGVAEVTASAGDAEAGLTVNVTQVVANFEQVSGNAQAAPAGEPLPEPLTVRATDELGNPIAGLTVEFAVTQGGGAVSPGNVTSGPDGTASTEFTLGPTEGTTHGVSAEVPGTDFSATFTATATAQPATLVAQLGNGQSALAGQPVPVPPTVRVLGGGGQPIPGVEVQFAVTRGDGTVTGAAVTTGPDGRAAVGSWQLGASGVNTLTATVPGRNLDGDPAVFVATVRPAAGFNIEVRHQGSPSSSELLAFAEAEVRWEALIVGDLPNVQLNVPANGCDVGSPAVSEAVDDLLILAELTPIDGPGNVLGVAGFCAFRAVGDLPVLGRMRFDSDDIELMEDNEVLDAVILHEMGHVLGVGTLWAQQGLLEDPSASGGLDPHFTGALAIDAFDEAGGEGYVGAKVPVENEFGPGTADGHWRESVMGNELMTGFVQLGANPLSAVTVQSLADQGYTVDPAGADPFTLTTALRLAGGGRMLLVNDIARGPKYAVDQAGTVLRVVRP